MAKEVRLQSGGCLNGFDEVARDHLDGMLATYGFLVEMSMVEAQIAMRRFRNGHRYITVEAKLAAGGAPVGNVKLGTGTTEWPEIEWNHIPLWRLIRAMKPESEASEYMLDNVTLVAFLDSVSKDLQTYAMDFIGGDLATFKAVRAEAARLRPAYEQYGSGPYSESTLAFMRTSKLLKEKFSSELAA